MTPKLTDEMREALVRHPGQPIEIEDEQTQKGYILVAREEYPSLVDERLRQLLQIGFEQSDRGESEAWEAEGFLDEAHRRHAQRSAP